MSQTRFETWHFDLEDLLGLAVPPVAIAFSSSAVRTMRISLIAPPRRSAPTPPRQIRLPPGT